MFHFRDVNEYLEWKFWVGVWATVAIGIPMLIAAAMKVYHKERQRMRGPEHKEWWEL